MKTYPNSVTTCTKTGSITLTLHLPEYLTPSLNTILSNHWSHLHRHKEKAKIALLSALNELARNSKMLTTLSAEPNLSPINFATLDSFLMTTPKASRPTTNSKSVSTTKTKRPSSKLPTTHQSNHSPHSLPSLHTTSEEQVQPPASASQIF